jgi:DNA replication protein DnaC
MDRIAALLGNIEKGDKQRTETCHDHGGYISRLYLSRTWTGCPTCVEQGYAKQAQVFEASRREEAMSRWRQVLGDSGIASAYSDCSLGNYKPTCDKAVRMLERVTDYNDHLGQAVATGRNLTMLGTTGTGKTHILSAITLNALHDGYSAIFMTAYKMVRAVRDARSYSSSQSESEVCRALAGVDLLAIDELGEMTAEERKLINDVINDRYERAKPVLISSNLDGKMFGAEVGARVADRLKDRNSLVLMLDWESYRQAGPR